MRNEWAIGWHGHLKICWIYDLTSRTKPAIFPGMTQDAYSSSKQDTLTCFRLKLWEYPWLSGAYEKWCGFPKVWVASASLDYLPWKKEHPAKVWNHFTVHVHRYLFTPSFIIFSFYLILLQMYWIFKPCSPTSSQQKCFRMRREHCAKFIFHAFPSADLRYNSGIDNKCKTVV